MLYDAMLFHGRRGEHCSSVTAVTTPYQRTANGRPYNPFIYEIDFYRS